MRALALAALAALPLVLACSSGSLASTPQKEPVPDDAAHAVFAGGCFWCMEASLEAVSGVYEVLSGYTGGSEADAEYRRVGSGGTGHVESVQVYYDPGILSYEQLLVEFWHNIDPTQDDGQFCDRGSQYRSAIFPATQAEREAAEASLEKAAEQLGKPIVTEIREARPFYPAEGYHQDYYLTNPRHYYAYRKGCGRDARLAQLWGTSSTH